MCKDTKLAMNTLQKCQDGGAAAAGGARPLAVQVLRLHVRLRNRRLWLRHPDLVGGAGAQEAARVHLPQLPEELGGFKVGDQDRYISQRFRHQGLFEVPDGLWYKIHALWFITATL